jgi:hypothetical protein
VLQQGEDTNLLVGVLASAAACLELQAASWLSRTGSEPLPLVGPAAAAIPDRPAIDGERLLQAFGTNLNDLRSVLSTILVPETQQALTEVAKSGTTSLRVPDDVWVAAVYQFLASHHQGVMRREHITQALLPLYLGRAGSFLLQHAGSEPASIDEALESLGQQFERSKPYLVERWHQTSSR